MDAMIIHRFGGPEVFTPANLPKPRLKAGHVLVEVHASSVNPIDYKLRKGLFPAITPPFPAVLHGDVSGVVVKIGAGVRRFKRGDAVYGCAGGVLGQGGALAEFMCCPEVLLAKKPRPLGHAEAAAMPLAAITAWEAIIDRACVRPGDRVLIHGGTGGVGHLALQLAKWAGGRVAVTASSDEKLRLAKKLGADHTIHYKNEAVQAYVGRITRGRGFDVTFDTVGGTNLEKSFEAAARCGRVAAIAARGRADLTLLHMKGLTLHAVFMLIPMLHGAGREHHGEILNTLARLVDEGRVRPLIDEERFSFRDVAAAHRKLELGRAVGKVVLTR
jgi:NADPH2:quinone reductase